MEKFSSILLTALQLAGLSLLHNWPYLLVGIIISALLRRYLDAGKISAFMQRFSGLGIVAATGAAVGTPLCSCGTTAVVLGMLASTMPWAPIVAFMVASPLTSPGELLYSAGLFGWPFALAFFAASIFLGLAGGTVTLLLDKWGWLAGQTRFNTSQAVEQSSSCACNSQPLQSEPEQLIRVDSLQPVLACACTATTGIASPYFESPRPRTMKAGSLSRLVPGGKHLLRDIVAIGRQLLPMFLGFAFLGYLLNGLIPASWISAIFGGEHAYSVPLAATLALPLYINTEGSLPLLRALLDHGMSQGAALAFLIAGSGTSLGAIAGMLTIARWRVLALVIGMLWVGAILWGYFYDLLLSSGLL